MKKGFYYLSTLVTTLLTLPLVAVSDNAMESATTPQVQGTITPEERMMERRKMMQERLNRMREHSDSTMMNRETPMPSEGMGENIVVVAKGDNNLSTLVAAVQAAGLGAILEGKGPYTVFAPSNKAFLELGTTWTDLLKPENKEKLRALLLTHIIPGKVMSGDIKEMDVTTVSGQKLPVHLVEGKVKIGEATVIQPDISASNGVVHVVDKVIMIK